MPFTDPVRRLLAAIGGDSHTLNQIVRRSGIPRPKVINLLARLIRFHVAQWSYADRQFWFKTV